ncbi:MAG TPA: S-layer homology domain-containing protein [Halanaerobiales bacterium]|nr:S-layer homology domain-containing protein [Halanaerobiales bacterium]
MKKTIIITLILLLSMNLSVSAVSINDVPANHWAYQSVKTLIDRGLLSLYDDGTFRGSDKVSRFELAEIVARILENIEVGVSSVSSTDMELLRKLSYEFRDELVDLAEQGNIFKEQISSLEQKNIIQDEFMTELKDHDIASLDKKIINVDERVSNVEDDVSNIIDTILVIKDLQEELDEYKIQTGDEVKNLQEKLEELDREMIQIEEMGIEVNKEIVQDLEDRVKINSTRLGTMQEEINVLKGELKNKDEKIVELEEENDNYRTYLYGLGGVSLLLLLLGSG